MTTATEALAAVRARIEGGNVRDAANNMVPFRWPNEDKDTTGNTSLPDTPAPFVYCEFLPDRPELAAYGGGRGANLYRNSARLVAYVFVPRDQGLTEGMAIAEQIAVLFRSYRDATISCFEASVHPGGDGANLTPPGLSSEVGNYFYVACEVEMTFDQVG